MSQSDLEALLGRSLTSYEISNLTLYLDIAYQSLEDLICSPIDDITETRVFDLREGYSTAFVDIFREVTEVKIDGTVKETSDYSVRQWDKRNASWYNSLVFEDCFRNCDETIEVTGVWGFENSSGEDSDLPSDLQLVIAGLFDLITKKNKYDPTINSKQVEDFRISFSADVDLDTEFNAKYAKTLAKYSLCYIPYLLHGKVGC